MNSRDKFKNTLNFITDTQVPEFEFGYWYDTLERWYKEGFPGKNPPILKEVEDQFIPGEAAPQPDYFGGHEGGRYCNDIRNYFDFDERIHSVAMSLLPIPEYEEEVIQQDEENMIYRTNDGKIVKVKKSGRSIPQFLEYPVKSKKDLKNVFDKFDPNTKERFPPDEEWSRLIKKYDNRAYPLQLGGGSKFNGFFSVLRELMGLEKAVLSFYDDPNIIYEILEYFTYFYIKTFSKAASRIDVDYIFIWEDMAYRNGPLISPDFFNKFILKYYKKFITAMKECGVEHFIVDSDGNIESLIPLFLEAGVTGLYPFEVQAGMDIEKIRNEYPELIILGGIDKTALSKGENEIIKELNKVKRMIKIGGYIPFSDHTVPPDVSFSNYCFFRKKMKEVLRDFE